MNERAVKPQPIADHVTLSNTARESLNKTHVAAVNSSRENGASMTAAKLVDNVLLEMRSKSDLKEQIKSVTSQIEKLREKAEVLLSDSTSISETLTKGSLTVNLPVKEKEPLETLDPPPENTGQQPAEAPAQRNNTPAISTGLET